MDNKPNNLHLILAFGGLALFIAGIVYLRQATRKYGGPGMNAVMQVGDFFVMIRFFGFLFLLGIIGVFLVMGSKSHGKDTSKKDTKK